MNRKNATRKALLLSVISLLLCCTMLVGTTFAWFTDSVTSGLNSIVAGNLDIELEYSKDATNWDSVSGKTDLFSGALWEPGHTEVVYLRLTNKGTLALNYQLGINVKSETPAKNVEGKDFKLSDYIQFGIVEGQSTAFASRAAAVAAVTNGKPLNAGYTKASAMTAQNETAALALVVYMPESVGNEANYRGTAPQIELGINVVASQKTQESDSFGTDYDVLAQGGYAQSTLPANATDAEIDVYAGDSNVKAASFLIPKEMIVEPEKPIEITIVPTAQDPSVTVTDAQDARSYDISVSNIQEANGEAIKVQLNVGVGLSGVSLYHKDQLVPGATYNPNTGYVTFTTTSFSPYTVVHDAVSKPGAEPEIPEGSDKPADLPQATVTQKPEYENVDLTWESFGGFAPTPGLDSQLEAAYEFKVQQTLEEIQAGAYANWHCDFYVKLDRDLGADQIFLGGNYGSFGWVGFHNGDLTLAANSEIPLLGSVTQNPWTYEDVASFVGTFTCGVGDVDDALAGATFTVMLRLTNPEDATEYYNVATISHKFEDTSVTTAQELKDALDSGKKEIRIRGVIELTESLGASNVTLVGVDSNSGINFNGNNIGGSGSITYQNLKLSTIALPYAPETGERYGWYGGIDYNGHSEANYIGCTITGVFTTYSPVVNATNCTFNSYVQDGEEYYNIFMYSSGTVNATNCTFMYRDRAIKIYSEGANTFTLNINGGQFVATGDYSVKKALINVDSSFFAKATINVTGVTVDSKLADAKLHNAEGNAKVTVDWQ